MRLDGDSGVSGRSGDTSDDIGVEYDRDPAGVPRWVKVTGLVLIVLALLVAVVLVVGGGGHGPRRHAPPGGGSDGTPPVTVPAGHQPPAGIYG
jgi:hypothetical protein